MRKIVRGFLQKLIVGIAVASIGILAMPACLLLGIIIVIMDGAVADSLFCNSAL